MDKATRTATDGRYHDEPCICAVCSSLVLGLQYLHETTSAFEQTIRKSLCDGKEDM